MNSTIPGDFAARIAAAAAAIDGVRSAIVCCDDGSVLGSARVEEPAREAALASFVAVRAESLPVDGDLRGMGKQLAGSNFSHMTIVGPREESALYNLVPGTYLSVRVAPGRSATTAAPLSELVKRVAALHVSTMRSS
ncbi:MAG: hypothetical protein AB7J35_06085 [Dehalococcoidia bacterium]